MSFISEVCSVLAAVCLISAPIMFIVFLVMLITKNKRKKVFGICSLCLAVAIIPLAIIGAFTDPATYCEHQWEITENVEPTCTDKGRTVKHCPLCDKTDTEYEKAKGHDMVKTESGDEIINRCSVCGYETVEKIKVAESTSPKQEKTEVVDSTQEETSDNKEKPYYEQFAESKGLSVELARSMDESLGEVTAKHMTTSKYSLKNISKQSFKQVEDWAYGARYYGYLADQYIIYFYCEGDEVVSIRTSNGEFAYKREE